MKRFQKMLHALLFPKTIVIAICVPVAAALLMYTFGFYGERGVVAYISYAFSAYALVILCTGIGTAVKRMKEHGAVRHRVAEIANRHAYVHRYLTDTSFKTKITLLLSMTLNAGYAVLKCITGIVYGSAWLMTLAAYYALLMAMRFLLFRHLDKNTGDMTAEWKRCRTCGIVLLFMNIILTGIVILILRRNEGFAYAGYWIYVMALYDFYSMTMAIVNLIKSRKHNRPVLTAAKVIHVAAALVSMLSLETAMLTQFGGNSTPAFRQHMIAYTGGGICIVMSMMAVLMIIKATLNLKTVDSHHL